MKKSTKIILGTLWGLFGLFWIGLLVVVTLIAKGAIGYMPAIEQLQNPIDKFASQVFSAEGEVLGSYSQSGANRVYVSYNDLSDNIVNALIATEDVRFRQHSGIDYRALSRAIVKRGLLGQKSGGGGSTITQQLAKMLYSPTAENVFTRVLQKPIEWIIAIQLERYYTKDEILSMYLNQFDFLYNAVGIRSAAYTYFGKSPENLNIQEAATLVGMCKNPAAYNPVLEASVERSLMRRNVVLEQMAKANYLTQAQCDSISKLPLRISFHRNSHKEGEAPYFRERVRLMLSAKKPKRSNYASWQKEEYTADSLAWETDPAYGWCEKNGKNLYTDGLKIYTTLSLPMQRYAEQAVRKQMADVLQPAFDREKAGKSYAPFSSQIGKEEKQQILKRAMRQSDRWRVAQKEGLSEAEILASFNKKRKMQVWSWQGMRDTVMSPLDSIVYLKSLMRTGFMAMNPHNGHIKAYVGGINFATFQYDMVSRGRRQVGSTIKPFLYSLAMTDGLTPCDMMLHVPQTLYTQGGKPWTPRGSSRRVGEMVSIKWGLQNSDNWVTAYLMGLTSPYTFVRLLRSYGLNGIIEYPDVSLCLGTADASIGEMVSAYSTFVGNGIRVDPLFITRIEDQHGNVLANFVPKTTEVLSQDAALKMLTMMRAVIDGGTGGRLRSRHNLKMPLGGKTGTTQNHSDAWFVGFTPSLVAGCWVGGEDRSIHFDSMSIGQGAASALPIFGEFMRLVYSNRSLGYDPNEAFEIPKGFSPCGSSEENQHSEEDDSVGIGLDLLEE
ncbi:penicillin-binding protein [Porphyromonas crevioricanis]|uniref:Penicillin-binding protein n=2 Tax=Porphyromonas crevioricanis TaxID=393921 RepID=A0A0A2FXR6_9PORP|nr:transglycosylase domain-containing protein [Porphyromonas crevioricanis]KGN90816.1 penicillin-binding protein [Porphyromonas crevioricanis]KGN94982.1 penicillin-binding protein [Porphyromonas crevioricanis]SJZ52246.1 penicillin-binding protein 1A [Porphyromonas crevioricanis]SQH73204.1 Penicillin-binding protein 1A [Porphyromonas crevioricanis]GAD05303.1 monofunctional biosynthetic peptidoglycan transglycosylase [Porphyromonas crevioricanis JCM 15906]